MSDIKPIASPFKRRPYQREVIRALQKQRCFILLWRRQGGKSTTLAEAAHFEMMQTPGRLVTYASASLLLGREIVFKESGILQKAIDHLSQQAAAADLQLQTADAKTHQVVKGLSQDDFADLFESQRLEFRLYHSRTVFSRTQVIAPNPATARGWTGTVMLDEFGFIPGFRDLWEAVEPIVSTDPNFHLIMATTPPKDDRHYSYELTATPMETVFPVSASGNWYMSQAAKLVHRVDIHDGYAAGVKLYDLNTGKELTPAEHFAQADDKDAHRRNYQIRHVVGGSAAVDLICLESSQRRGIGQCAFVFVDTDLDFEKALAFLVSHLGPGPVGIGLDVATTTAETSNPSSVTVTEQSGVEYAERVVVCWKTKNPKVATERVRRIVEAVKARERGGPARRLCIDASNERYFAEALRDELASLVPVELVINGSKVHPPGYEEPTNMKTWLGDLYAGEINDNHFALPPERYVKDDHRLVVKDRGAYACEPQADGKHGDTFDSGKLSLRALTGQGPFEYRAVETYARNPLGRRKGVLL